MLEPPSAGADQDTRAEALSGVALGAAGVSGTVRGVTASDGVDQDHSPAMFSALTRNMYE